MHLFKAFVSAILCSVCFFSAPFAYALRYEGFDIDIDAEVGETYDDNITYASTNEQEDFITTLKSRFGIKREDKTQLIGLAGTIAREIFVDYGSYDNTSYLLNFDYANEFTEYDKISIKYKHSNRDEPRSFDEQVGRTAGRYSITYDAIDVNYERDISKHLTLGLSYNNYINDISLDRSSDSTLHRFGTFGHYFISSQTRLSGSYDFSTREFDPGFSADTHTLMGSVRQYLNPQLYVDGTCGVDFIESFDGDSETSPVLIGSLTNEIDINTYVVFRVSMRDETNAYTEDLLDSWRASASVARRLLERLTVRATVFYDEADYEGLNVSNDLLGLRAELTYELAKDLRCTFRYSYSDRESSNPLSEYTKNTLYLGLNKEF